MTKIRQIAPSIETDPARATYGAQMKFLVTNDDGIEATGLEALVNAARPLGDPVVVAPVGPQSGVSHAVTWHEGVRIEPREENRYAIHGTPADCVRLG